MPLLSLRTLIGVAVLTSGLSVAAADALRQTPEQRYFDWTSLPFPAEELAARRAALVKRLAGSGGGVFLSPARKGLSDGFTFRQSDTFWYLTGLEFPDSVLVLDADSGRATLYAPARDARFESASRPNDFPGRPLRADPSIGARAGLDEVRPIERLAGDLAAWVKVDRPLRVDPGTPGPIARQRLEPTHTWTPAEHFVAWLQHTYPSVRLVSAFPDVARVRMVKSPREIDLMRRAARLAANGIAHAAGFVKAGVDERTLEAEFEAFCKRGGAERLPFASIIKSGPNAVWPWRILATHNNRRNRTMQDGELVIFDVGCEIDGYVSDTGRTFPVSGRFTEEQRDVLAMEVRVADALIAALRPGITLRDAQREGARAIPPEARPYMQTGLFFGHHLGLSSGDPFLEDDPLAPGMVITVEPWYYNHDRGISVFTEDVVLITPGGRENLTASLPRSPDRLEALVSGPTRPAGLR